MEKQAGSFHPIAVSSAINLQKLFPNRFAVYWIENLFIIGILNFISYI